MREYIFFLKRNDMVCVYYYKIKWTLISSLKLGIIMKNIIIVLFISTFFLAMNSFSSSFRLTNGKLISIGDHKSEIIALVGMPLIKDVEKIAIDKGLQTNPIKREVLTYKLKGSIGGSYLVIITVENNIVVSISSKQDNRI